MVSLRFREFLGGYVAEEFDSLVAQLRSFFSVSFNEDGTLQGTNLIAGEVPIGGLVAWTSAAVPANWLLCDGSAVSRITYKRLFEVLGTTYGAGDGSTTFNLPDLRQRMILGKAAAGTGSALGATGGAIDHTHNAGSHTHTIAAGGGHSHTVDSHAHSIDSEGNHAHTYSGTTNLAAGGAEGAAGAAGGFLYNSSHGHTYSGTTDGAGSHDHSGATGSSAPSTDSEPDHNHGGVTGAAGGTTDAANPPYIALNYIILAGA